VNSGVGPETPGATDIPIPKIVTPAGLPPGGGAA
jgi:hypothetical protein